MIKKNVLFLLLGLLLTFGYLMFVGVGANQVVNAQTNNPTITTIRNHLLADVNEVINLSEYKVKGSFGEINLDKAALTSSNPAVTITQQTVTISEKGIFQISMSYQSVSMNIFFITKLASEAEYVIYSNDFNNYANGALPYGLTLLNNLGQSGGSAAIDNHRLFLSPYSIVLFPSYLQGFSNYIIETDMRMSNASNDSRWTSIMFRYQTENYYQMAIRKDATANNGVEFAKRIEGNWNVPATASNATQIELGTTYKIKVDVFETTVKEYINDNMLIEYDGAFEFSNGRIGVHSDNVSVYYDNIKITLPEAYIAEESFEFTQIVDVYQPQSGIVSPATSVTWFNDIDQLDIAKNTVRPATMIFRIDSNLQVVDQDNNVILAALDALIGINGKIIPAFYTNDVLTASAIAELLKKNRIIDCFIISDNGAAILAARTAHNLIRGVLNFPLEDKKSLTNEELMNIRYETNRSQSVAAILPGHLISQNSVEYMQKRAMTVWVTVDSTAVSQFKAILSGANGIITNDYEALFAKYSTFTQNTHVRRPLMIAHRGLSAGGLSGGPECTIEAALESYSKGADIIEIDVHITLDLEVVVIHDATTARTAPAYPSLTVAQSTLAQLKSINLNDPIGGRTDIKIPTLIEFMETFKGSDVVIFIEIKPTQPLLVESVAQIVNDLNMYDQSAIIAFSAANINTMNQEMPELSNGFLTGAVLSAANVDSSLTSTFSTVVPINATINPHFGALTQQYIEAISHRGITVWPWTLNEYNQIVQYYNYGVSGITTDHFGYLQNTFNRLEFQSYAHTYTLEEAMNAKIQATIQTQNGTTYPYMPSFTVISDGNTGLTLGQLGNITTVENAGIAYVYTTFTSTMPNGINFTITSDLIEITIVKPTPVLLIVIVSIASLALFSLGGFYGYRWIKLRKLKNV